MKRQKRLRDRKSQSAASRVKWGSSPEAAKKMKKQQRKKLRLANKEIDKD